jgi:hypothetical protein
MEYCAWLDSQSEAARRHANKEDTRYQAAVLSAPSGKLALAEREVQMAEMKQEENPPQARQLLRRQQELSSTTTSVLS